MQNRLKPVEDAPATPLARRPAMRFNAFCLLAADFNPLGPPPTRPACLKVISAGDISMRARPTLPVGGDGSGGTTHVTQNGLRRGCLALFV